MFAGLGKIHWMLSWLNSEKSQKCQEYKQKGNTLLFREVFFLEVHILEKVRNLAI